MENISKPTDKEIFDPDKLIYKNPTLVFNIENPTENQVKTALEVEPTLISLMPEDWHTENIRLFAIKRDAHVIENMGWLSKEEQSLASQSKTVSPNFVLKELLVNRKNSIIYESTLKNLIRRDPNLIFALKNPTEKLLNEAINNPKCDDNLKEKITHKYKVERQSGKKESVKV